MEDCNIQVRPATQQAKTTSKLETMQRVTVRANAGNDKAEEKPK